MITNREEIFSKELSFITDDGIRKFVTIIINELPEYFFKVPASSTGKYHPSYTLGDGGLVRHVKAAVNIAHEILQTTIFDFNEREKDIIYSSLILHDGLKHGEEKNIKYNKDGESNTVFEHPLIMGNFIIKKYYESKEYLLPFSTMFSISSAIRSHMGQWTTSNYSTSTLPEPRTQVEKFVHLCDYLASRKNIIYLLDEEEKDQ